MKGEPTVATQRLYQGRVVSLRLDTVALPNGGQTRREIVEHGASVAIVPVDGEGRVLLVRQYRKAVEETLLEAPAGGVEPGEALDACAQRELQEETGYRAGRLERLGGFYASPGYCTEFLHLYLATDLEPSPRPQADDEDIEVVAVPLAEVPRLLASGGIKDAKSVAGLLWALRRLGQA